MKPKHFSIGLLLLVVLAIIATLSGSSTSAQTEAVEIPSGIRHESFDRLLGKYVNERGLVAYSRWKQSRKDLEILDDYIAQYGRQPSPSATGTDRAAGLINLYNALTIRWILENYPTRSIQATADPFGARRHFVAGRKVSLNDIEHSTLRPQIGWRAHGVLVCAARSCPPLQRTAYTSNKLSQQIDTAYRTWLAREDLNRFLPQQRKVEISSIFKWFKEDFDKAGGIQKVLTPCIPLPYRDFFTRGGYETVYLPYDWSLNDQAGTGKVYSRARMVWDRIVDFLVFWK